jgi:hypothetical protein
MRITIGIIAIIITGIITGIAITVMAITAIIDATISGGAEPLPQMLQSQPFV